MNTVIFREPFLGIRKNKSKSTPAGMTTDANQFFKIPEESNNLGTVVYANATNSDLRGKTVYFGSSLCELRINGEDILIFKPDQIFAIVSDQAE